MPFLERKQAVGGEVRFVARPEDGVRHSRSATWSTRLMRRLPFVVDFFLGRELRDEIQLPDYGF